MLRVSDIMTRNVCVIGPELSIGAAMELLSTQHVSGVPVVAGGELLGVISASDIMEFAAQLPGSPTQEPDATAWSDADDYADPDDGDLPAATYYLDMWDDAGADTAVRFTSLDGPEWNTLDEHTVAEAMTRAPIYTMPSSAPAVGAADYMRDRGVHRLLIVDDGQLVGIVTNTDIARAAADRKLTSRTYVFRADHAE